MKRRSSLSDFSARAPAAIDPPPPRRRFADIVKGVHALVENRIPPIAVVWALARDGYRETRLYLFEPGEGPMVERVDYAFQLAVDRCEVAEEKDGPCLLVALHTGKTSAELPPVPHPHRETTTIAVAVRGRVRTFAFAKPVLVPGRARS